MPYAPADLMVESVSEDSVTVKWSPSLNDGGSAILHYIIVMRESTKKKFKKVGEVAGNTLQYSVTSNIEPTKECFIRVYAENSIGISESAAEIESAIKIPAKLTEVFVPMCVWVCMCILCLCMCICVCVCVCVCEVVSDCLHRALYKFCILLLLLLCMHACMHA